MEYSLMQLAIENGGVPLALAAFIFLLVRQMRQDRKFMEDRLTKIIEADQESRKENTTVMTQLITWLKTKNGNK